MKKEMYLVGGAVRDLLLGLKPYDYDFVAVGYTSEELEKRYGKPTGLGFAVYRGIVNGYEEAGVCEIAMARTERSTGPGYRDFEIITGPNISINVDLKRRDFTINAMAMDSHGNLVDPFGGQKDLQNKVIRLVNDRAFYEDPVRVLRLARFAAKLPGFKIDPGTLEAAKMATKDGVLNAAIPERVLKETLKEFRTPNPSIYFKVLNEIDALRVLFPELRLSQQKLFALNNAKHLGLRNEMLFALLVDADNYNQILNRLNAPNSFRRVAKFITANISTIRNIFSLNVEDLYNLIIEMRRNRIALIEPVMINLAMNLANNVEDSFQISARKLRILTIASKAIDTVTSDDVFAVGIEPGSEFGKKLKELRIVTLNTLLKHIA